MSGHALKDVEGFVKRGSESFIFDPRLLTIREGFNKRDSIGDDEDDLVLKEFIRANGSMALPSLWVQKQADKSLLIRDGHRRHWACMELIKEGVDIRGVPVQLVDKNMTDEQALFMVITSNAGKPLSPFEEARTFQTLKNYGHSVDEIAKRVGRTPDFIYKRLKLVNATSETREAVKNGSVGITIASKVVASSGGDSTKQAQEIRKASVQKKRSVIKWDKKTQCLVSSGFTEEQESVIAEFMPHGFSEKLLSVGLDPETVKFSVAGKVR